MSNKSPSVMKSLVLAVATLALSTWALGSLWLHAEEAERGDTRAIALNNAH